MSHTFREVHPHEFEAAIKKAPQEKLDQERDYTGKRTFLNQDGTVGYALSNDGYWGNLFSLVRGGGSAASQDAINRGALYGNAFETKDNNLVDYYRKFGLVPFAREANWTPGEPDVVHMKLPHAPVPAHIQKKIDSGEARLESGIQKSEGLRKASLYHGTLADHENSIMNIGLAPESSAFIDEYYDDDHGGGSEEEPVSFSADKKGIDKAITAMRFHVGKKLNKPLHDVTEDDVRDHGMIAVFRNVDPYVPKSATDVQYPNKYRVGETFDSGDWYRAPHKDDPKGYDYDLPRGVEPSDYFTRSNPKPDYVIKGNKLMDFLYRTKRVPKGTKHPSKGSANMQKFEGIRKVVEIISKPKSGPHPHAYEWHDGHTTHHGSLGKADDDDKAFEHKTNEQVATVGVPTYQKYAEKYGKIDKTAKPIDTPYDYRPHGNAVDQLAKKYGFQVYFAGGKYGKPDLANKNYDTGWLMVYDPSPDSGNDFGDEQQTRNYRIVHELAHALTHRELNETPVHGFEGEVYGERPRLGRLGVQRPLRDAMRAVYWEHLAANKQRELSKEIGLELPDTEFAKEYNTVMHDAAHRAVTGRFTEPSKEGFQPHDKIVPLEVSMKLVTDAAKEKGLKGLDDVAPKVAKSEDLLTKTEQLLSLLNEDLDKGEKKYSKKVTNPKTGREKTVKYGAKGYTIAPGTSRGDSYCARSYGQMKDHPGAAKDPNSPLRLSRAKWRCSGKYSRKFEEEFGEILDKAEELQDRLECMMKAEQLAEAIEAIISSDVELGETQIERVRKSEALLKRIVG